MKRKIAPYPTVFVTAHTHVPFIRQLGETLLVNVGAVGLPGDGDWRASYGRLTWTAHEGWQARSGAWPMTGSRLSVILLQRISGRGRSGATMTLVELRSSRDAKTRWTRQYGQRVLDGEISMEDAVNEFLSAPEFQPYL